MSLDKLLGDDSSIDPEDISPEDAFKMLVGETGKYKTPEALAMSALHKERHIAKLEQELADARKDIKGKATIEDILAKLSSKEETPPGKTTPPDNVDNGVKGEQDIMAIVERELARREEVKSKSREDEAKAANRKAFVDEIKKAWGPSFKEELGRKAKELGLSDEALVRFAEANPSLMIKALGVEVRSDPTDGLPPKNGLNPSILKDPLGQTRNEAFYKKMMKTEPTKYWSPKVQKQRLDDALRLGAKFFSQ